MTDISLSSAVRSNLLSLQNTANLLGKTQERLSTGLKVNSALDDPTAFFTASSLNSRAGDLNRLLDSVGNAVQTVKAADDGISAITKLVENAQATARQALQKPAGSTTPTTLSGSVTIADDVAAVATGTVSGLAGTETLASLGFADSDEVTIEVGGVTTTFAVGTAATDTVNTLITALDGNANASVALSGGAIVATAGNNTDSITFGEGGAGTNLASIGFTTTAVGPTNTQVAGFTGTLSIQVNSDTAETIDLSGIDTRADLATALGALSGVTASITSNVVTITAASEDDSITIAVGDEVGLTNGTTDSPFDTDRQALETEFNNLRTQIDQLASDASYNGVNLLNGDSLSVIFNEDGSSSLSVTGVTFNSSGLGVSSAATDSFQTNANIESSLTQLDTAISSLRQQGSTFGSNLSVVEVRQDFTKNLINTLETGAANLTLADSNQEGANMLALQTRQQLSTVALTLANQADQAVLRLF
ncbi:MAG: flagellar protein [Devosiaceae bacterium]|nr:flagellar protein [Devosiaceae bacterium]